MYICMDTRVYIYGYIVSIVYTWYELKSTIYCNVDLITITQGIYDLTMDYPKDTTVMSQQWNIAIGNDFTMDWFTHELQKMDYSLKL